ncbi:MAG: copper chaperone PCu(A)C [Chloroflexi bacterium]|nr:copper chaperone PCu(A)C [Chloroflexota bacterium]
MHPLPTRTLVLLLAGLVPALLGACRAPAPTAPPAGAGRAVGMDLRVDEAWSRAALAGFNGALYLSLENRSPIADRLTGVIFDAATRTEIHRSRREGDMVRMELQADGVALPAGERLVFEPGGYHVMLLDLKRDLVAGETLDATLEFEEAGRVPIRVAVRGLDAP